MSGMELWIAAAGAALSAYSSYQQGKQQEQVYKAQSQVEQQNALIEQQNAAAASQAANAREEQHRRQARQILGEQRAAQAQSGVGLGGSSADIAEQSAINAELDALGIRYEGELERRGHLVKSQSYQAQAGVDRFAGKAARRSGNIGAAAGLLSAAASGYGAYSKLGAIKPTISPYATLNLPGR